jgi:hypothetical protein
LKVRGARTGALVAAAVLTFGACLFDAGVAAAATPDTGTGSAFGVGASGLLPLSPTPSVTLPATGAPPQSASAIFVPLGLLFGFSVLGVKTSSSNFGSPNETISSSASLAQVTAGILTGTITITAVQSDCTSNASGSQGTTSIQTLVISGTPVSLSFPIPVNEVVPGALLGPLNGLLSITLNAQSVVSVPFSTSITVDAVKITFLGDLDHGETLNILQAQCSAAGPDIDAPPATTPEVPLALSLPVLGALVGGGATFFGYRRRRNAGAR